MSALDVVRRMLWTGTPTLTDVRRELKSRELARDVAGYISENGVAVPGRLEAKGECHWRWHSEFVESRRQSRPVRRLHAGRAIDQASTSLSGDFVREARTRLGLSLDQAASALAVNRASIHSWEKRGAGLVPQARIDGLIERLEEAAATIRARDGEMRDLRRARVHEAAIANGEGTIELLRRLLPEYSRGMLVDAVEQLVARGDLEHAGVITGPRSQDGWRVRRADAPAHRIPGEEFGRMLDARPRGTELALARLLGVSNSLLQQYRRTGVPAARVHGVLEGLASVDAAREREEAARAITTRERDTTVLELLADGSHLSLFEVHRQLGTQSGWVADSLDRLVADGRVRAERTDLDTHGRRRDRITYSLASAPTAARVTAAEPIDARQVATGRQAAGITQSELAVVLGVTNQSVSLWERGRQQVPPKHWERIRETLGL